MCRAWIALLVILILGMADSRLPPNKSGRAHQSHPSEAANNADACCCDTNGPLAAVQMELPTSAEAKSPEQREKPDEKSPYEGLLVALNAISAIAVAAFTGFLYNSTEKLWKGSKRASDTAEVAGREAQESMDSYKLSERAWVSYVTPAYMCSESH
jgi:hypothetical protein